MGEEARQALLAGFAERFSFQANSEISRVELADAHEHLQRLHDKISEYTTTIGENYAEAIADPRLAEVFRRQLQYVSGEFQDGYEENEGRVYFNAMAELHLATQVDALFCDGDLDTLEVFDPHADIAREKMFAVNLSGIEMTLQAGSDYGETIKTGDYYKVTPDRAEWRFDPNGIRLTILYFDPVSNTQKKVNTRMDFHMRRSGESADQLQAALDLDGEQMHRALSLLNVDYHLSGGLTEIVKDRETFEKLKQSRMRQAVGLNMRQKKADAEARKQRVRE